MITKKQFHGGKPMLDSMYSMITLAFILIACVELCDAATVVDVYRLIQYDISGIPLGSRLSSMNHLAASSHLLLPPSMADLSRSVLLLPLRELSLASSALKDYVAKGKQLGGLLLLLPQILNAEAVPNEVDRQTIEAMKTTMNDLELLLIRSNIPYPVYFAFEDENLLALLSDVRKHDAIGQPATATTGGYKLVVSTAEPKKVLSPFITNIQGWLPGKKADEAHDQLPTIAIVSSYDTFGSVPALSVGSASSGSGVVALLEIARLFSLLYSNPRTRGRYNILFGLTSGGPYNYNGTQKWLRGLDHRVRESIDFAICLNSIGSWDKDLWLHVSKSPENAFINQILEEFSDVAKELGVEIGLKHKKINISNTRVGWEHEQFSRMRITAATLSDLSSAPEMLENNGNIFDSRLVRVLNLQISLKFKMHRHFVREEAVLRSIYLVAETIARHIYGLQGKNVRIISGDGFIGVNSYNVKSWLDFLSRTPRVAPLLSKNDPLISALQKELSDHTEDLSLQQDPLDGIFTFYDSTKAQLNIYQVASVTFDLLLLLAVCSYLIVLFCFLLITTRGLDDLIGLFRRPPSRKVKTA